MDEAETIISRLVASHPGRQDLITQLATLLSTTSAPCIHIHAPLSPNRTASLVRTILTELHAPHAYLHAVECLSPRIVYNRALNALAGWDVQWEEGCVSFGAGKYTSDLDGFIQGLRAIARGKGSIDKMVVVIECAERFKENVAELMVPLTRLAELSGLCITTIFVSEVSWFDLRPPLGAALDPFLINTQSLSEKDAIASLVSLFPARPALSTSLSPYTPHLKPLYAQYIATLYSTCAPFISDTQELAYIAAACWPAAVAPLLADWRAIQSPNRHEGDGDERKEADDDAPSFALPTDQATARLVRYFTPSFTRALESLYPREKNARQWATENVPPPELRLSQLGGRTRGREADDGPGDGRAVAGAELTTVAKYVLVASFLASSNPAKADARMVGRAPDERGKKKRGGGTRKTRGGGKAKVPQRLLGPAAFPLERLLAVLGSLMEEHDSGVLKSGAARDEDEDEDEDGIEKDTEMAVGRIQVSATISELVARRLLHRTAPADKVLDASGPGALFKCGVSQARAFELAREIGVGNLGEFMWDQN